MENRPGHLQQGAATILFPARKSLVARCWLMGTPAKTTESLGTDRAGKSSRYGKD